MIAGVVNRSLEIVIPLPVRDAAGQNQVVEVILDAGFTGSLTLPPALINSLGLLWRSRSSAVLANGNVEQFDVYTATVVWDGVARTILVPAIDNPPLLGMALLSGHDLRARIVVDGAVEIEVTA
jgi:clan AA aspartic protease